MKNLKSGNLSIELEEKDNSIRIKWLGKSDRRDPANLISPYLENLAQHLDGRDVEVDFQGLRYMNSSTVPPIIQFMKDIDLKVKRAFFIYDKTSNWQAASFKALKAISKNLKNIEVKSL